jgi:hypothetical protein
MVATVPNIGTNVAAADNLTATASADLVSAATNTGGIVITSMTMSVTEAGAAISSMELKVNAVTVAAVYTRGNGADWHPNGLGSFCAIRIPAGQAISYTFTEGSNGNGWVRITWKAG